MLSSQARKKPKFFRKDWNKKIKLGSQIKKKRKWRAAVGRDNKMRLRERGYARRPAIGWRADKKTRGKVKGMETVRVENIGQLEEAGKGKGIIIGRVGKKKREELLKVCKEKDLKVLNKYGKKKVKEEKVEEKKEEVKDETKSEEKKDATS